MKKIAPHYYISKCIPSTIKKFLDKTDNIGRVTILTTVSAYTKHIPQIELFSDSNRTLSTGVDSTCFGSWSVKDAQEFIADLYTYGEIQTPIVLCDNGVRVKKDIIDAGNRTRTLKNWEDDVFRLSKNTAVQYKGKTYNLSGMSYSDVSVKYPELHKVRYSQASAIVKLDYNLSGKKKAKRFLNTNKAKSVKSHEKLFVETSKLIRRLRNLAVHMPIFKTKRIDGVLVPTYLNLTDKGLEAPKNMLKLFAYMQAKHTDGRELEDIKISKSRLTSLAQSCNLSPKGESLAWQKMCQLTEEIRSIYDAAPTTKYDEYLSSKKQSDSTSSRYFNVMFIVLDNFEYFFGTGAEIKDKKSFQSAMIEMFSTLDSDEGEYMDESMFKRHTRKLFDPVPKGAKISSRLGEIVRMISRHLSTKSPSLFGVVYKDTQRRFPRSMIDLKFAQQDFRCGITNKEISRREATGAHIIPHCKGGPTTYENLIVVSRDINTDMGSMTLDEYMESRSDYTVQ